MMVRGPSGPRRVFRDQGVGAGLKLVLELGHELRTLQARRQGRQELEHHGSGRAVDAVAGRTCD